MGVMLYTVLSASGGFVNGLEVAIGAEIPLTDAEARYEVDLGTVAPTGREPPIPPLPPALLDTDLVETRRDRLARAVVIAALEAYLLRAGGGLAQLLDLREGDLAARLTAQGVSLTALRTEILGGADAQSDTLGKIAALLAAARQDADAAVAAARTDTAAAVAAARLRGRRLDLAAGPSTGDLADGETAIIKNLATGRVSLWHRDGDAVRDLLDVAVSA